MKKLKNNIKNMKKKDIILLIIEIILGIVGVIFYLNNFWFRLVFSIVLVIVIIYFWFNNTRFLNNTNGNGIIFGARGRGKGLLLNKKINSDKGDKHFCNVPYNKRTEIINIKEYIDSIKPLTTTNFINDNITYINKNYKFEKRNIYWDDVGVYAPNFMDNELKKYYPSLSALLPITRHIYDNYMIITTQDIDRPYKLLKELQTDFSVRAVKTVGFGGIFGSLPFIRYFVFNKYIYYENKNSASAGVLPFQAKGLLNETIKHGILTAGQSTKEVYEAQHGVIFYGWVSQLKRNVNYDTRIFHEKVFGHKNYKQIMPDSEIV